MNETNKKCAPSKKYKDGSCFSLESLKKIAKAYNMKSSDKIDISDNKNELVKSLENKMSNVCDSHTCWLRQNFVKDLNSNEISKNTFRPTGPHNSYDWLSTSDINEVIEQYHQKHKDFRFLGAVPIDFDDLPILGINNLDFNKMNEDGVNKIGIVFNLDEHYKSGSHWVAFYADFNKYQAYFFDSYGKKPDKRIRRFISRVVKQMYHDKYAKKLSIKKALEYLKKDKKKLLNSDLIDNLKHFDIDYNKIRHQYKNSECGVYSISFILNLLDNKTFNDLSYNKVDDDIINKCRNVYFR